MPNVSSAPAVTAPAPAAPVSHRRAWAIGGLYVVGAALPRLQQALAGPNPINWPLVACEMVIPAAVALRGYLDGTIEQLRGQTGARDAAQASGGSAPPPGTDLDGDSPAPDAGAVVDSSTQSPPAADSTSNSPGGVAG